MIIYKITCLINGKIYIGQTTTDIEKRWRRHTWRCTLDSRRMAISNAIDKYGKENFKIELIDSANSVEELNEKEVYYINMLNSLSPNGYNIDPGGNNKKMRQETKDKISSSNKGKVISELTRLRLSISHKGYKMKDDTKKKLSDINKLKSIDNKVREAASLKNSKVYLLEKDGILYVITNMKKFAENNKHCKSNLSQLITGKKQTYKGFTFIKDLGFFRDIEEIDISEYLSIYNQIKYE